MLEYYARDSVMTALIAQFLNPMFNQLTPPEDLNPAFSFPPHRIGGQDAMDTIVVMKRCRGTSNDPLMTVVIMKRWSTPLSYFQPIPISPWAVTQERHIRTMHERISSAQHVIFLKDHVHVLGDLSLIDLFLIDSF